MDKYDFIRGLHDPLHLSNSLNNFYGMRISDASLTIRTFQHTSWIFAHNIIIPLFVEPGAGQCFN